METKQIYSDKVETTKGITAIKSLAVGKIGIITQYETALNPVAQNFIIDVRSRIAKSLTKKLNGYAMSYFEELDTSFNLYGLSGLITQLNYLLCNIKDKSASTEIKKIIKELKSGGVKNV